MWDEESLLFRHACLKFANPRNTHLCLTICINLEKAFIKVNTYLCMYEYLNICVCVWISSVLMWVLFYYLLLFSNLKGSLCKLTRLFINHLLEMVKGPDLFKDLGKKARGWSIYFCACLAINDVIPSLAGLFNEQIWKCVVTDHINFSICFVDLLYKDYSYDHKFSFSTQTASGLVLSFSFVSQQSCL